MNGMWGADTTALREMSKHLERGAAELTGIRSRIDQAMTMVVWHGKDRDMFTQAWTQSLQPMLTSCGASLDQASSVALENAEAQDQASTADDTAIAGITLGNAGMLAGGPSAGAMTALGGPQPAAPPKRPKPDLDSIMRNYQVNETEMVKWTPPWPKNNPDDARDITVKEAELLNKLSWQFPGTGLLRFQYAKECAEDFANEKFPLQGNLDGHNDAFRHAMWNAIMVRKFGAEWAQDYSTAHEQDPRGVPAGRAMDLYNNEMGRRIATNYPDASEDELAWHISNAISKGDMLVIDEGGSIAWSDQVQPGFTGKAAEASNPKGKAPNFNDQIPEYQVPE